MPTRATIRMYRLNELGDCFLVTFDAGRQTSRMLIDCGSFRNGEKSIARLEQIARHMKDTLAPHTSGERAGTRLDVIVGTHQHNDHISGFYHCRPIFNDIGVGQVWLSWLDDPLDPAANAIGKEHGNLAEDLSKAAAGLRHLAANGKIPPPLAVLDDMLGFYGARTDKSPPVLPASAVERLKRLSAKKPPRYLSPGNIIDMPGLPKDSVRVHVLGPPRQHDLLYRANPRADESYDHKLTARIASARKFLKAVGSLRGMRSREDKREENDYPFTHTLKCNANKSAALAKMQEDYDNRQNRWRRIDRDWLNQAESLALFLDTYTNNSSLALAIELVESGKVLLFAADAQAGNWRSWAEVKWDRGTVTTDDLLARTVLYKVGHHASHNATLKPVLDSKMTHPDLCALIPVHRNDPNIRKKKNGWKMPARNLFRFLKEKTTNRVLRMDLRKGDDCHPSRNADAWKAISVEPKITPLYIELALPGDASTAIKQSKPSARKAGAKRN
jgi:glyoxylase-like metal-dependent hydrolase (beta-lactamase superfamily II)